MLQLLLLAHPLRSSSNSSTIPIPQCLWLQLRRLCLELDRHRRNNSLPLL
jgi:hypothetical protein